MLVKYSYSNPNEQEFPPSLFSLSPHRIFYWSRHQMIGLNCTMKLTAVDGFNAIKSPPLLLLFINSTIQLFLLLQLFLLDKSICLLVKYTVY